MKTRIKLTLFTFSFLTLSIGASELMKRNEAKKPTSGQCTYSDEIKKPFHRAVEQGIFQ